MTTLRVNFRSSFLLLSSFILVAFGQPAWNPFLAPIAAALGFAFFWMGIFSISERRLLFWVSVIWFTGIQLIALSWLATPRYQGMGIFVPYVALSFLISLQFAFFTLLIGKEKISLGKIVALSSLWTLFEWIRLFFLCGFSWNPVGISLSTLSSSLQWASLFGVYGLTFWVIFVNLLFYRGFVQKQVRYLAFGIFAALIPYLYGSITLHFSQNREGEKLSVALVQTALYPSQKSFLSGEQDQFINPFDQWGRTISFLKKTGEEAFDLIVFPEAAFPFGNESAFYSYEAVTSLFVREFGEQIRSLLPNYERERWGNKLVSNSYWARCLANIYGAEVIVGLDTDEESLHYNAAFHFRPHVEDANRYEKQILVPLAEYLPITFLRPLSAQYGITEFFSHGKETKVLGEKVPLAISICYEETYPHIVHQGKKKGAKLLLNITNDNWFPDSRLFLQHFFHGRIRAVENGLPLLRSCNTGITAIVDSYGRIEKQIGNDRISAEWTPGVLQGRVALVSRKTLYSLWGDSPLIGFSLLSLLFFRFNRKEK